MSFTTCRANAVTGRAITDMTFINYDKILCSIVQKLTGKKLYSLMSLMYENLWAKSMSEILYLSFDRFSRQDMIASMYSRRRKKMNSPFC